MIWLDAHANKVLASMHLEKVTGSPVIRNQSRAIERGSTNKNPQFENIKNAGAPSRSRVGEMM